MYWCFGFKSRNLNITSYNISKELYIAPLSGICAIAQIRCFKEWKNSSCIIAHLINNIPVLSHYSWAKKSRRLLNKYVEKSNKEIRNFYWENDLFKLLHCLRAEKYKKFKFDFRKEIRFLTFKYSTFSLGFFFGLVILNVDLNLMSTLSSKENRFFRLSILLPLTVFLVLHTEYYHVLYLMKSDLNLFVLLMIYLLTFHLLKNRNLWRFLRNLKKILKIILIFTYCTSFLAEVQYLKY